SHSFASHTAHRPLHSFPTRRSSDLPKNKHPNPKWQSPLKDPEAGRVWCTDCHGDKFDFSRMPKQRFPQVDALEQDHEFMVDLMRSEEHTSELQSPDHIVCRLLLEKT